MGAFANPFDADKLLWNGCPCGQHRSIIEHNMAMAAAKGKDASRFQCEDVDGAEAAVDSKGGERGNNELAVFLDSSDRDLLAMGESAGTTEDGGVGT